MTAPHNFTTPPSPVLPHTGEELCRLCAEGGNCCCGTDPDVAHLCFPLSIAEWRRMAPYTPLATQTVFTDHEAFAAEEARLFPGPFGPAAEGTPPDTGDAVCASEENGPGFIAAMERLFGAEKKRVARIFPPGGRHFRVRTRGDGACVFWGSAGCRLPRAARPWYCLLFPAWVHGESLTLFTSENCLVAENARGPAHGLALLQIAPEQVRLLYAALRTDWGLDG